MGELYSTLCALLWAVAVILFRKSGEVVPPVPLNVFKNTVATGLFVATLLILGIPLFGGGHDARQWLVLLASGAIGIGVADSLFFAALARLGAGRVAVVDCAYSPFVLLCSLVYLHEPARPALLVAMGLMLLAILVGAWKPERVEGAEQRRKVRAGVALGVASMFLMAVGVVMAKPVLDEVDPWWATTVRVIGGMALLAVHGLSRRHRAEVVACFRPSRRWRVTVPAAVIGSYLAMFFWITGMKLTTTTTAAVLNQLSTIFILVLATAVLREALTARRVIAVGLAFAAALVAALG